MLYIDYPFKRRFLELLKQPLNLTSVDKSGDSGNSGKSVKSVKTEKPDKSDKVTVKTEKSASDKNNKSGKERRKSTSNQVPIEIPDSPKKDRPELKLKINLKTETAVVSPKSPVKKRTKIDDQLAALKKGWKSPDKVLGEIPDKISDKISDKKVNNTPDKTSDKTSNKSTKTSPKMTDKTTDKSDFKTVVKPTNKQSLKTSQASETQLPVTS